MKNKILIIFFVLLFLLPLCSSKVLAETKIKETIQGRFGNYDVDNEYKIEVTDNKDKKIVVRFKGLSIIESYAINKEDKFDLMAVSKITHTSGNKNYYLYIQYITDSKYQLDYTREVNYSVYINDELRSTLTAKPLKDERKGNAKVVYYNFKVDFDIKEDMTNKTIIFYGKVYIICYILSFLFFAYTYFYGFRRAEGKRHGGIVKEKDIDCCREIPQNISLEMAYASLYYCSKISTKKLKNGIIGAYILKWFNDGNITITNKGNKVFSIDLKEGKFDKNEVEQELYDLLKIAAGNNGILDNTEFKVWSRSHKNSLNLWHRHILDSVTKKDLKNEAKLLLGLRKFLLDYSLIDERRHIEIKLWEQYLIYAQVLGIADEVSREFKKVFPDYSKLGELTTMDFSELIIEYILMRILLLFPMALAMVLSMIVSGVYYIINY